MLAVMAAAAIVTAVDAERAFIRDAHAEGQWTAFRKWADGRAVMFTPAPVWAQEFLKGRKDPPKSIDWAPGESWVSCDGTTAINRGLWTNAASGGHGFFTTVWVKGSGNWRWVYDGGGDLQVARPLPRQAKVNRASCTGRAKIPSASRGHIVPSSRQEGHPAPDNGQGASADGTLVYEWKVASDGARQLLAKLWDGQTYRVALEQNVPAPPK